jgi:hypothetical protein
MATITLPRHPVTWSSLSFLYSGAQGHARCIAAKLVRSLLRLVD